MIHLSQMPRRPRPGYTLVEAMVALSLTAMAGAVVLLTVETSLDAADQALEQTIAAGMAEQLLDEVMGAMYCAPGSDPHEVTLAPDSGETLGSGRDQFDEIGDYNGYLAQPPEDRWGKPLGHGDDADGLRRANFRTPAGVFDSWRQQVEVYYVQADDPATRLTGSQTSDYRAVEVVISRQISGGGYVELARLRRVVAFVPQSP
jgi:type II secretory pathway pseudopilin PulG